MYRTFLIYRSYLITEGKAPNAQLSEGGPVYEPVSSRTVQLLLAGTCPENSCKATGMEPIRSGRGILLI